MTTMVDNERWEYKQYTLKTADDFSAWLYDAGFYWSVYGNGYGFLCTTNLYGPAPIFLDPGQYIAFSGPSYTSRLTLDELQADPKYVPAAIYVDPHEGDDRV